MDRSSRNERTRSDLNGEGSTRQPLRTDPSNNQHEGALLRGAQVPDTSAGGAAETRAVPAPILPEQKNKRRTNPPIPTDALPENIERIIAQQTELLKDIPIGSSSEARLRSYVEFVGALPWAEKIERTPGISVVERSLEANLSGFKELKERIVEHALVTKFNPDVAGPTLAIIGPPGRGKTLFTEKAAEAMHRRHEFINMAAVRSVDELFGSPRGSHGEGPGLIIQAIKNSGSRSPVLVIEGFDKVSPERLELFAAALEEIVDPKRRAHFMDRYVGEPIDLSRMTVIFVGHAIDSFPDSLRKHLEEKEIGSYSVNEKILLARRFLIPEQMEEHGLYPHQIRFSRGALEAIINNYTMEGGVHHLKQRIAEVCRKRVRTIAKGEQFDSEVIEADDLIELLGAPVVNRRLPELVPQVGVVYGLAWTSAGGEVIEIEANHFPGTGQITCTGSVGGMMQESARAAYSFVRAYADELGIPEEIFGQSDLHINLPAGGVPKDGPSAGLALGLAIASTYTGREANPIALTGEVSLRGRAGSVSGYREKILAAKSAGIPVLLYPEIDDAIIEKVLAETPELKKGIALVPVGSMEQVLEIGLCKKPEEGKSVVEGEAAQE